MMSCCFMARTLRAAHGGAKLLVAGPDADATGAVVLDLGRNHARSRLADTPEIVVDDAGTIYVS